MSSFSEAWKQAGDEAGEYKPPTGEHTVKIVEGSAFTSRSGDDYAKIVLQILGTDLAGRRFQHFMGFANEVAARINREALLAYGLRDPEAIDTIDGLDDRIQELIGTVAEVGVTYKNEYLQIKVFGSRPPNPVSDIPTDDASAGFSEREQKPAASFADAARRDDDDVPFT